MATAVDSFYPFDSGAGSTVNEDQWRAMMRRGVISGVIRGQGSDLLPFGDSSGMQVKVPIGEVMIESYWGQVASQKILSIGANSSGVTRYDLVVARAAWVTNDVELDVIQGTGGVVPQVTRNTSLYEVPLAVVTVINGAATITAAQVNDARQWGGPPVPTVTNDFLLYGDKISSCTRFSVASDAAANNSVLYFVRLHSLGEQVVSDIRLCPTVLPVGGTMQVRIFRGYRQDQLTTFVDPTTSTFLYGGTTGQVHASAIPTQTFRAGEVIVVAVLALGTTSTPSLAMNAVTVTSGVNMSGFVNPGPTVTMVAAFKGLGAMPTSLNLLDASWTLRDRTFWAALG